MIKTRFLRKWRIFSKIAFNKLNHADLLIYVNIKEADGAGGVVRFFVTPDIPSAVAALNTPFSRGIDAAQPWAASDGLPLRFDYP
jgi:hypothetical protein